MTGLFPHQGNRTHIVPSRRVGPVVSRVDAKVTQILLDFDRVVQSGDDLGFTIEINGTPVAIIAAINANPDEILITFAAQLVGDLCVVRYKRTAWRGDVYPTGDFVQGFSRQAIIT